MDSETASTGSVLRTMEDSRVDPMVTMADNSSTKGDILTVADYAGAGIANYRFGDVIYPDQSSGFCTQAGACPTLTYQGGVRWQAGAAVQADVGAQLERAVMR